MDSWNRFDASIVLCAMLGKVSPTVGAGPSVVRMMRLMRVLRLMRLRSIYTMFESVVISIPAIWNGPCSHAPARTSLMSPWRLCLLTLPAPSPPESVVSLPGRPSLSWSSFCQFV